MDAVHEYIEDNKQKFLEKWFEALRVPSVSALPENKEEVRRMAEWYREFLENTLKMDARIIETDSNPLVFAESPKVPGAPTVLIYGHFDVQPTDPLDEWNTPPFEPTLKDGKVFCRGADDDKGQTLAHLFALQSILAVKDALPLQVKFILDGEEEIGSFALSKFLESEENRKLIAADAILVSDTDKPGPDQPGITCGLRGIVGYELTLDGPFRDLHSGLYGGSVRNPALALCTLLNEIMDDSGRIQIPGFYDDVRPLSEAERKAIAERPFDEIQSMREIGVGAFFGEPGYTILERRGARPSFDVNGLTSGYQGTGGKTIIPSKASAKFTFRLVPDQDPEKITAALRAFLKEHLPAGVEMNLEYQHGAPGMAVSLDSPYVQAAARGLESVFGNKTLFIRDGGSIPIIAEVQSRIGADLILVGLGLEEDGIHSPNEFFALSDFYKGIHASAVMIAELAAVRKR